MATSETIKKTRPVAPLKIAYIEGSRPLARQVNSSLVKMRKSIAEKDPSSLQLQGYIEPSYLLDTKLTRYGTGEGRAVINESVR